MFTLITAENGVKYLRSDMLKSRHGFSTRIGGVSEAPHTASLNLAFGRGDPDETVRENLRRFAAAIGVAPESCVRRSQIHSAIVWEAGASMRGEGFFTHTDAEGDGFVCSEPDVTLCVSTADCVPILMEDPCAHVIGAVHAGWRGAAAGIAAECVRRMCALGADAKNIRAAIGPSIEFACYEVGAEFPDAVAQLAGRRYADACVRPFNGRLHADVAELNRLFLIDAGVPNAQIDRSDFCTYCHPELFWSHRYTHGERGAMLGAISL